MFCAGVSDEDAMAATSGAGVSCRDEILSRRVVFVSSLGSMFFLRAAKARRLAADVFVVDDYLVRA